MVLKIWRSTVQIIALSPRLFVAYRFIQHLGMTLYHLDVHISKLCTAYTGHGERPEGTVASKKKTVGKISYL